MFTKYVGSYVLTISQYLCDLLTRKAWIGYSQKTVVTKSRCAFNSSLAIASTLFPINFYYSLLFQLVFKEKDTPIHQLIFCKFKKKNQVSFQFLVVRRFTFYFSLFCSSLRSSKLSHLPINKLQNWIFYQEKMLL